MRIITPVILMVVLISINTVLSYRGRKLYWLYEASHFLGGFLLAALFLNFLDKRLVLLSVLGVGIIWEIYEFAINKNNKVKKYLENRFKYYLTRSTFSDTILDLLLNVLGAAFYLYFLKK